MKVSAIPAYYPKYFRTKKNSSDFNSSYGLSVSLKKFEDNFNFLIDANYSNILMAKRLQAFKGVPSAALKTIPIEEKIATIFEKFNHGDLLLIGKDLRSAKNAMKKSVVQLKSAVKKVFFIEEHELPGSIAFFKNDTGKKEFINICFSCNRLSSWLTLILIKVTALKLISAMYLKLAQKKYL